MIKKVLIIIAGVVSGAVVIYLVEALGHTVFPPPADIDMTDPESIKTMIDNLPIGAFMFVLAAYALGSFIGGLVSMLLSPKPTLWGSLGAGIVLMIFGLMNLVMIPHPVWFVIISLLLYLPFAYLGGKTGRAFKPKSND
jgi:hypothetical protein